MKRILLSLMLFYSLGGIAIAADDLDSPIHNPGKLRERSRLFDDVRSAAMTLFEDHVTINTQLRKQLVRASIPYIGNLHPVTFSPPQEDPPATGVDAMRTIFANLRRTVMGIFSDMNQETTTLITLLEQKKEKQTREPTPLAIESIKIQLPPALFDDVRSVAMTLFEYHFTINAELRKQLIRASIPYAITQHPPVISPPLEEPVLTGVDGMRKIFANLRNSLFGIISGVEQENATLIKLLVQKKQHKKDPSIIASPPHTIVPEHRTLLRTASAPGGTVVDSPDRPPVKPSAKESPHGPTLAVLKSDRAAKRSTDTPQRKREVTDFPPRASVIETSSPHRSVRRASTDGGGTPQSPQRPPMVDVNNPYSPNLNRFLLADPVSERYTAFVKTLLIPKPLLSTIEPLIKQALEAIKGADYFVTDGENRLREVLNANPRSLEALQAILQNGISSPSVQRSDKEPAYTKLNEKLEGHKRDIEAQEREQTIIRETNDVLSQCGIIPGWGKHLTADEIEVLKEKISGIVSVYHNKEYLNINAGMKITPLTMLIGLIKLRQGDIPEKLEHIKVLELQEVVIEAITAYREDEIGMLEKLRARGKELDASIPEPTVRPENLEFQPTLYIGNMLAIERVNLEGGTHHQRAKQLPTLPRPTGFVSIEFAQNPDQKNIYLKVLSLIKPKFDKMKMNFNDPYEYQTVYYKGALMNSSVSDLETAITKDHELWVFTPDVTGWSSVIYFFAIPRVATLPAISLTLTQGHPRLDGAILNYIQEARDLMSKFGT